MTLLIADDLPLLVHGLGHHLESAGYAVPVAETPEALWSAIDSHQPTVLLLGFLATDTGATCFRLLRELRQRAPDLATVVLSPIDDPHLEVAARRLGARGFLIVRGTPDDLRTAIATVRHGGTWFRPPPLPNTLLTPRQLEVIQAVARWGSHKVAATGLHLSLSAVDHHLAEARRRLGNIAAHRLVVLAFERRLLGVPPESLAMTVQMNGRVDEFRDSW